MNVIHDESARRFSIATDAGQAVLDYFVEDGRVVFTHTFVPPALRGRRLAETLVRAGLTWAEKSGLKIGATCSYVARFLQRHPLDQRPSGR